MPRLLQLLTGATLLLAIPACSDDTKDDPTPPVRVATTLDILSGNNQSGAVSQQLANAIVVEVRDQFGLPIAGATVTWNVTGGGGTLSAAETVSDGNGRAGVRWTLGASAGANGAAARIGGLQGQTATFTATALAP